MPELTALFKDYRIIALKIALMLLSIFFISWQVKSSDLSAAISLLGEQLQNPGRGNFILVLLLMPANWLIETVKWKMLTDSFCRQGYIRSMRGVLSGIAISFFTPNRSGDFAGRILHLPHGQRVNGAVHSIAGSLSQLMVTITAGTFAFLALSDLFLENKSTAYILLCILLPLSVAAFHLLFFRIPLFGKYVQHFHFKYKWMQKLATIRQISRKLLIKIYALSILRYAIFTLQFWLLLQVFSDAYSGWMPPVLIMISFLFMSVIPSFALGEIGIRGSVCMILFSTAGFNGPEALVVSGIIWLLNVALPAVAGAVSMLYFRLGS
jgi:hypothetical protein